MGYEEFKGRDKKPERFCPKHDRISRKNSDLDKWITMDFVLSAKFDPSLGHNSLKNKSYNVIINSHNLILNSSTSFEKDLFQISK